ncbi:bactofilin family protein [Melioribacter sp. OK-6-Me]|uniref:bactofilin family protein n=1 Tax=unclassified Melioribacter TaxID=2627329 RepID=UPI003ED957BB
MALKKEINEEEVSIISNGVKIEGNINSEGNVRIDGIVRGNLSVNGNLTMGEQAQVIGEIKARNVITNGKVEGKIIAAEKLRLESKAVVKGDIISRILIVEEGAVFDGNSSMNAPKLSNEENK